MSKYTQLIRMLKSMDGKSYKAYKDIRGEYKHEQGFMLFIDHVQGDPFASPSKVTVQIPLAMLNINEDMNENPRRKLALEDFMLRKFAKLLKQYSKNLGTGGSGRFSTDVPGQEIIFRSNSVVKSDYIQLRFYMGLPAFGRRINGKGAVFMFNEAIPSIVRELALTKTDVRELWEHIYVVENAYAIRKYLEEHGYVAFVADGSLLPRESGVSDKPLVSGIPFQSPESLRITIPVPHGESVSGMAIKKGITLITGGGFHGKSTLLSAIAKGIFYHIPGDGREYVVTTYDTLRVRAEDGRKVEKVDISMFINGLPGGKDTVHFSTDNASGSTSQAASIIEAIQAGAKLLLMDEDTCATNFMVRDYRMQRLIPKKYEPITPLIDRIQELYDKFLVSTIMVVGGLGDFLDIADTVIVMEYYEPYDFTDKARQIVKEYPSQRIKEEVPPAKEPLKRFWISKSLSVSNPKVKVPSLDKVIYGKEEITFYGYDMFNTYSQLQFIGGLMQAIGNGKFGTLVDPLELKDILKKVWDEGLWNEILSHIGLKKAYSFAAVRHLDLAVVINRYRRLKASE
ncbi:ATPase [bacterium 3DAC]|nr:ATPase [bacterium 3DAC]